MTLDRAQPDEEYACLENDPIVARAMTLETHLLQRANSIWQRLWELKCQMNLALNNI